MMHGDGGVDQVAAQRPQPREGSVFVGSRKPASSRRRPTTKIAASFRVSLTALRRRDRVSRFGSSGQSL